MTLRWSLTVPKGRDIFSFSCGCMKYNMSNNLKWTIKDTQIGVFIIFDSIVDIILNSILDTKESKRKLETGIFKITTDRHG